MGINEERRPNLRFIIKNTWEIKEEIGDVNVGACHKKYAGGYFL